MTDMAVFPTCQPEKTVSAIPMMPMEICRRQAPMVRSPQTVQPMEVPMATTENTAMH